MRIRLIRSAVARRGLGVPCSTRSPWWAWGPSLVLLLAVFATWDEAAVSLFLGVIVPMHVVTAAVLLAQCPSHRLSVAAAAARVSMLVPAVLSAAS